VTDFARLLQALCDADVDFIIVGGLAAAVHGSSRLTQDVDIVYDRSEPNLQRLAGALAPFDPYLRGAPEGLPFEWSDNTLRRGLNFTLITSIGAIDLLGEIVGGGGWRELRENAAETTLFGCRCLCLDLDGLIRAKRAAGRPKDLDTVAELEALLEERRARGD
jgi:hypothetical protein